MMSVLGKTRIDYWSLDTEGSEPSILNATDFDALDIRILTVEVNDGDAQRKVESVMATKPYKLAHWLSSDLVYIKNGDPALAVAGIL
ncbi:hypothetical protein OEZ86_010156 [Tetradesmus obliquus]|nr:hypothetical protein OEZ86_010156 [Tetradesmus obliquus]